MKRIVIAAVLVVLIAVACIAQHLLVQKSGGKMVDLAQRAYADCQAGELTSARQAVDELGRLWQSAGQRFSYFVGYDDLRLLEQSLLQLPDLCRAGSEAAFLSTCAATEGHLRRVLENQRLRLSNIL